MLAVQLPASSVAQGEQKKYARMATGKRLEFSSVVSPVMQARRATFDEHFSFRDTI
jgi:hypothetical protein